MIPTATAPYAFILSPLQGYFFIHILLLGEGKRSHDWSFHD
ncbi:MAG: hypothetical protein RMY28_020835 [Nostoc sp. ChiSLP01]